MKDQILHFLALENLTPTRFADMMQIQRSGLSHILAGRNKPSFDFIQKMLLTFPNLNAEWLLLGKGNPYKGDAQPVAQGNLFDNKNAQKQTDSKNSSAPQSPQTQAASQPAKTLQSITLFYSDSTFSVYKPQ